MRMTEHERQAAAVLMHIVGMREPAIQALFTVGPVRIFLRTLRASAPSEPRDPVADGAGFFDANRADLIHIADWLTTAVQERHAWLSNVDDLGRPKKLLKAGDLEVLVREADKAEARLHQRDRHFLSLASQDEVFVTALSAAYTLVRLLSPDALDLESDRMRHCIGHGAYDEALEFGAAQFFSVRDQDGQPRATLEIVPREIDGTVYGQVRQFRGRRNADPEPHVADLIAGVMLAQGWIETPKTKARVADGATEDDLRVAFLRGAHLR